MCSSVGLKLHNSHWGLNLWVGTQAQPKLRLGFEPLSFTEITHLVSGLAEVQVQKEFIETQSDR